MAISPERKGSQLSDHYTFEFDASNLYCSPSRPIESEEEDGETKLRGEHGIDIFEDGPVNVLWAWLFDMADIVTATAFLIANDSNKDLVQPRAKGSDQIIVASKEVPFDLDSLNFHLTGRITKISYKPNGSFDKVTIEVEVTPKSPTIS